MEKTLADVLKTAEKWSREDQEELAEFAREIEARRTGHYTLSHDEREAVSEGLAQANRREFVPDDVVTRADKRHG